MATVGDVAVADSAVAAVLVADAPTASPALPRNLLSLQQSDVEFGTLASPDFKQGVGAGGSISRDATQAWHGSSSLKAITDGSGSFQSVSVNAPVSVFTPLATYTFSAYMKASAGAPVLRFYCQANDLIAGNTSIGSVGNVTLSTTWTRYSFTVTMPASLPYSIIGLRADTGNVAQAITWWMDGMQIEVGSVANAWTPGSLAAGVATLSDSAVHAVKIGDMRAP